MPRFSTMANAHSPTRFNGDPDNWFDPNYSLDINKKMRVPKSIRVNGGYNEDELNGTNGSSWSLVNPKVEMNVPDRILVVGQEQHVGAKAPPREIAIENEVMHSEPPIVRCITPPRVLTLDTHYYPAADDLNVTSPQELEEIGVKIRNNLNESQVIPRHVRENTPAYGVMDVSLPPGEEFQHLKRQMNKLNRRIMALESEVSQQGSKLKVMYITASLYFLARMISWFGKN
ncbi:transport and Golgi organization protein 11 isoform X2 [Phymastichus coffea]|uniref:transport and Golgi organization protein 11 isoform X2 n=1 Tax=Phymastichus coffea TaxID=108790 RepID=UPI00273AAB0C|nr:transport and Golgi organization protein 11 isoform X2 [Phymastichus coffea]